MSCDLAPTTRIGLIWSLTCLLSQSAIDHALCGQLMASVASHGKTLTLARNCISQSCASRLSDVFDLKL